MAFMYLVDGESELERERDKQRKMNGLKHLRIRPYWISYEQ